MELNAAMQAELEHLSSQQVVDYATDQLDETDRVILETHLEECPECDADVADLRLFRATLYPMRPRGPAPVQLENRRRRWPTRYQIPLQISAMTMLVVLIAWVTTSSLRSRTAELEAQVAELRKTNEELGSELRNQANGVPDMSDRLSQLERKMSDYPSPSHVEAQPDFADGSAFTLSDGGRTLMVKSDGNVEAGGLIPERYAGMVRTALSSGRLGMPPALLSLGGVQMRSASKNDPFQLQAPVGIVVSSDRPRFGWTAHTQAETYIVALNDVASGREIESEPVSSTTWVPEKPLERGHTYSWTIVATLKNGNRVYVPGSGSPPAKFKILDKSATTELERAKSESTGSHTLMAILYARHGLVENAKKELKALKAENPKAQIITRLQRSLKK